MALKYYDSDKREWQNLPVVQSSAYLAAVAGGYTGTEEEFHKILADALTHKEADESYIRKESLATVSNQTLLNGGNIEINVKDISGLDKKISDLNNAINANSSKIQLKQDILFYKDGGVAQGISFNGKIKNTASGTNSFAEGQDTSATGMGAHAEGYQTVASGVYSHAEGKWTKAEGSCSHTSGLGTIAKNGAEVAFGKYNESNEKTVFSIGWGTSDTNRKNLFEIRTDGSAYINGIDVFSELKKIDDMEKSIGYLNLELNRLMKELTISTNNE